ncbi:Cytochrome P450 ARB 01131 [Pyrenophora tritici-repentis]|nr:Cytochrome P450 ARB 01131 [Pyrenophora tritici-repentis]KAI2485727.1 Cytochrome P450 ARB 01131 [Pyrenophora tritici-repentis]
MSTLDINFVGNKASKPIALFFIVLIVVGYKIWSRQARRKKEDQYAMQIGCKAPRKWAAKWPQGLDLLKAGQHARAQNILQFFLDVVESSGPTHEQQLLGSRGINTEEPRNIEEILSI